MSVRPRVSTVVPVYGEEESLPELHRRLAAALEGAGMDFEAIYVDEGNRDRSAGVLRDLAARDPRVVVVDLNRNYGQHAAMFAGLHESRGETVVTLDADLQPSPPRTCPRSSARTRTGSTLWRPTVWPGRTRSYAGSRRRQSTLTRPGRRA